MDERPATQSGWVKGMNSMFPPEFILEGQYAYGENVINRGGVIQTRPGQMLLASIPGKLLQGFEIFTPNNSRPSAVAVVDGFVYVAKPPFTTFTKVDGLKFEPLAPFVCIEPCIQSVRRTIAGLLELIEPVRLVIIGDGVTKNGYYDGTTAKHLDSIPVMLWMQWTASRLWGSNGHRILAGDIADPTQSTENSYLAERSSFELPGDCTGLIETADQRGLLAFTRTTTTAFQSSVRDRSKWQLVTDFQKLILPSIGNTGGFAPVNAYGLTFWMTTEGFTSIDAALSSLRTSRMAVTDGEMNRCKAKLSADLSGVATCSFANMVLVSAPVGSRYNTQTWVLDQSAAGEDDAPLAAWSGVWSGTRPVKWSAAYVDGKPRAYYAAYDATASDSTHIHIWQAFLDSRTDRESRIPCQFETAAFGFTGMLRKIKWVELELGEIYGAVTLSVYIAGRRGPFIPIIDRTTIEAKIGCLTTDFLFTKTSLIRNFKRQTRTIRSKEFSPQTVEGCSPEVGKDGAGQDRTYTILVEWRGQMGIHSIKFCTEDGEERKDGQCPDSEEGETNVILETGEVIDND